MRLVEYTADKATENLAIDELLLAEVDENPQHPGYLRLWESPRPVVVIGRSSQVDDEVDRSVTTELGIPVLRRVSGGAAIVCGPGCLMYAVVQRTQTDMPMLAIDQIHQLVMSKFADALRPLQPQVEVKGICDLTIDGRKVSGNSLRCGRRSFLYHGTLLYDFPLELLYRCLRHPPRQPDYRRDRQHEAFVANLAVDVERLRKQLIDEWNAVPASFSLGQEAIDALVAKRYSQDQWNYRR